MNAEGNAKPRCTEPEAADSDEAALPSGVRLIDKGELDDVRASGPLPAASMHFRRRSPHCVLSVEAPACEDMMPELYRLLVGHRVQVVRVHAQVRNDRVLHELAALEHDGTPLDEARWRAIQAVVIAYLGDRVRTMAMDLAWTARGRSQPPRRAAP